MVLAAGIVLVPRAAAAAPVRGAADAVVVAPRDFGTADLLTAALGRAVTGRSTSLGSGLRIDIVTLPRTALARVTPAAARRLRAAGFAVARADAAPPVAGGAPARAAIDVLNTLTDKAAALAAGGQAVVPRGLRPLTGDLHVAGGGSGNGGIGTSAADGAVSVTPADTGLAQTSPAPAGATLGERLGYLPTATAPDAFAAGSVAVSVIFPQSTGSIPKAAKRDWSTVDPSYSNLTTDPSYPGLTPRQAFIMRKVSLTLAWWAARDPGAHLTFVLPAAGTLGAPQQVDVVDKEPITIYSMQDAQWRDPIMRSLLPTTPISGADTPPPENAYDDAVRTQAGADWAFTLYCVDDLKVVNKANVSSGMFPDYSFAYTFYSPTNHSPYVVTTWDNDGYGPGLYDGVLAHEVGHVFGALDEYDGGPGYPSTGDLYAGYLWIRNRNAVVGGTTDYRYCIMRGGDDGIRGYENNVLKCPCPSTRGQIGWRDSDGDGTPDVIDTSTTLTLGHPTSDGSTATVSGSVTEKPWPHGHNAHGHEYSRDLSVLVPSEVAYRVDGGDWTEVTPVDGSFGEPSEAISMTTPTLGPGPDPANAPTRHLIEVRASGADPHAPEITGRTTTKSVAAWVGQTPVALSLSPGASTIKVGAGVKLTVGAKGGLDPANAGYPIAWLPDIRFGPVGGALQGVSTGAAGTWTKTVHPKYTTTWQASFAGSGQFEPAPADAEVTVGVKAKLTLTVTGPGKDRKVYLSGRLSPARAGVPLVLQRMTASGWTRVTGARTSAKSTYVFTFRPAHKGTFRLRIRFAGDQKNLATSVAAAPLAIR